MKILSDHCWLQLVLVIQLITTHTHTHTRSTQLPVVTWKSLALQQVVSDWTKKKKTQEWKISGVIWDFGKNTDRHLTGWLFEVCYLCHLPYRSYTYTESRKRQRMAIGGSNWKAGHICGGDALPCWQTSLFLCFLISWLYRNLLYCTYAKFISWWPWEINLHHISSLYDFNLFTEVGLVQGLILNIKFKWFIININMESSIYIAYFFKKKILYYN